MTAKEKFNSGMVQLELTIKNPFLGGESSFEITLILILIFIHFLYVIGCTSSSSPATIRWLDGRFGSQS